MLSAEKSAIIETNLFTYRHTFRSSKIYQYSRLLGLWWCHSRSWSHGAVFYADLQILFFSPKESENQKGVGAYLPANSTAKRDVLVVLLTTGHTLLFTGTGYGLNLDDEFLCFLQ